MCLSVSSVPAPWKTFISATELLLNRRSWAFWVWLWIRRKPLRRCQCRQSDSWSDTVSCLSVPWWFPSATTWCWSYCAQDMDFLPGKYISFSLANSFLSRQLKNKSSSTIGFHARRWQHLCQSRARCQTFATWRAWNLFVLILSRGLPENFNESRYIFVSVCTTTFLWTVFLPTYFTTFYTYHKAALLAFCLIVNAVVTLLCLFVPKLYAIYFVNENEMNYGSTIATVTMNKASSSFGASKSSQVAPAPSKTLSGWTQYHSLSFETIVPVLTSCRHIWTCVFETLDLSHRFFAFFVCWFSFTKTSRFYLNFLR